MEELLFIRPTSRSVWYMATWCMDCIVRPWQNNCLVPVTRPTLAQNGLNRWLSTFLRAPARNWNHGDSWSETAGSEVRVPLGESIWILAKWFWRESTESIRGFCEKQLRESTLNKEQFYFEIDAQCTYICNVTCYGWGPGAHLKTPVGSKGYESSRVFGIFRPKNQHPDFWGTNSEFWGCQKHLKTHSRPNPQPEPNSP